MSTFYPNSSSQIDILSTSYIQDQKFTSYSESPSVTHGNIMMYLNEASSAGSHAEIAHGSSMSAHNLVDITSMAGRNEVMFIPPTCDPMSMQIISGQLNSTTNDGERNLHGLSLSLNTNLSTVVAPPSFQQFSGAGTSLVPSAHLPLSGEDGGKLMTDRIDEDFENSVRVWAPNNLQYLEISKAGGYNAIQFGQAGNATSILKCKYLKPTKELLDEVANVWDAHALKQKEYGKDRNMNKIENETAESKEESAAASNVDESATGSSQDLSASERQDLQNKLDKLLTMLDEVDRRYKQYYHQMQIMVSSFDLVAGCGASKPYTTLALKTISRHFRTLQDAISSHIQSTRKILGEQETGQGVIPRLRYVDQKLRQQRAFQQFGMMRHAWRPQRGLPESAVTVLRAWLFEHFLHPYPKDSEKIMLARQTGLTRGQVANWFINARVRLWKPMIEDMYKEEFGDADLNLKSSPKNATTAAGEMFSTAEDKRDKLQGSIRSMDDSGHPGSSHDESEINIDDHKHSGLMRILHDDHPSLTGHGFYPHDQNSILPFQVPDSGNYGVENQVSLALGLQHIDGGIEQSLPARATLRPVASSENTIGPETAEYSYFGSVNQQHKFGNSHLLNNFVV